MKAATKIHQPDRKLCPVCGFDFPHSASNCAACGTALVDRPPAACHDCGLPLDPGNESCSSCQQKGYRSLIRPLVEAAVIGDHKLSRAAKDFVSRKASEGGIPSSEIDPLIADVLSELGAIDETRTPCLKVEPSSIRLSAAQLGSTSESTLEVLNTGSGEMAGVITARPSWLTVTPAALDPWAPSQTITIRADTSSFSNGAYENGLIQIESTGGTVAVQVSVDVDPTSRRPDSVPGDLALCPSCRSPIEPGMQSCSLCGLEPGLASKPPGSRDQRTEEAKEVATPTVSRRKGRGRYVAAGIFGLAALIALSRLANDTSMLQGQITNKLRNGQLVAPIGDSAYDLWQQMQSKYPKSAALSEVSRQALAVLRDRGEQDIQKWHDHRRDSDLNWPQVSRMFEWATAIEPNDRHLQALKNYSLGQIAFGEQRFDDALKAYLKALEYDQRLALAYNDIGRVYVKKNDYRRAEENYKKATECDPNWCYPYRNLGGVYAQASNYPLSERYYQKAVTLAPTKPSLHYQFALLYEVWNRPCDARAEYRKALDLLQNDPEPGFTADRVQKRVADLAKRCG